MQSRFFRLADVGWLLEIVWSWVTWRVIEWGPGGQHRRHIPYKERLEEEGGTAAMCITVNRVRSELRHRISSTGPCCIAGACERQK